MSATKSARLLDSLEVNRVDGGDHDGACVVNKVDRLPKRAVDMAKARMGAAVEQAIGDAPLKAYGDKGLMSKVLSGEKVPDYLARIVQDKGARRRFALALLEDDSDVIVTTTITIPQIKKVD